MIHLYRIGTSRRPDMCKNTDIPGPGNYEMEKGREGGPKWGFGTSKRPPLNSNNDTPGPGGYEAPNAFGSVPKYAMRR
jgi:hypothetical protein